MNKNIERAKEMFLNNSNCAQSVIAILGPDYGLDHEIAYKLSSAFGGGLNHQGKTCGAVLGAFMVLGLKYGNQIPEDSNSKQILCKATDLFVEKFTCLYGSIDCPGLLKYDIRIEEEQQIAKEKKLFNELCPLFVQSSIEIIQEIKNEMKEAGSRDYFEEISEDWDTMRKSFFSENIRLKIFEKAGLKTGSVVADIGAGSGFITEGLLDKDVIIKAIDQSPAMIEVMKKKFKNQKNIEYFVGNSDHLPLESNSVDFAFCNMYLHHVNAPQKAINEIYRILKPGGTLISTDADKHDHRFLVLEQYDRWLGFDRNDIKKWFEKAGFKKSEVDCLDEDCCPTSKRDCNVEAQISIFIASGIK
jgi:C_GCAxxG_C_C family probable redox protein